MLQVKHNQVSGYKEKIIHYSTLSKIEDSKSLVIMFPGVGYTVQGPLFHFATGIYLNKGMDILHLEYSYGDNSYYDFTDDQLSEAVIYDSGAVIDRVLEEKDYENFYLIGKSFGTIAMSNEIRKARFKKAKAVWLTPLLKREDVFTAMKESSGQGLCFIGDHDPHYVENRYKQLKQNPNMIMKLYPKVNHSMEYEEDILKSIDVVKDVIRDIDQF